MEGRKAMSAEPPTAAWVQGKRWEDLIEAATSATDAGDDRDLTPVSGICSIHDNHFDSACGRSVVKVLTYKIDDDGPPDSPVLRICLLTMLGIDHRCLNHPTTTNL